VEEKPISPATSPKGAHSNNNNTSTSPTSEAKKGTSISQTLQAMKRGSKSNSTGSNSIPTPNRASVNSLKKSEKEAIQDELAAEFPRHKYQTIQSFRPEEVKELLAQHFMKISSDTQQSSTRSNSMSSEDGRRKFFHLRPARRSGPVTGTDGDSGDGSFGSFIDDTSSGSGSGTGPERTTSSPGTGLRAFVALKQENIYARTSFKHDDDQSADHAEAGMKDPSKRLSRKETHPLNIYGPGADKIIQDLKDQLSRERRINSEQLNKMRAKQKKLKVKMILQQEKLDALLLLIEAREHNVQAKLNAALENE